MSVPEMYESGLQSERTELAWRRTALGLLVGSVVAWRLLAPTLGWVALALGILGLGVTAAVWVLAARRSRCASAALSGVGVMPGGGLLLVLAGAAAAAAALGVAYALG